MRCSAVLWLLVLHWGCGESSGSSIDLDASVAGAGDGDFPIEDADVAEAGAVDGATHDSAGSDASNGGTPRDGGTSVIEDLRIVESAGNVLAYHARWTTTAPVPTVLDVACAELGAWTIAARQALGTTHEVFVMGLVGGIDCEMTARAEDGGDIIDTATVPIEVADVPDSLPDIELVVADEAGAAQPGWTLINLRHQPTGTPYTVALVDRQARIRWYYQASTEATGEDTPVAVVQDGVAFGGRTVKTTVIDWSGDVRWTGPTGHHEVQPTGEPGHLYYVDHSQCEDLDGTAGGSVVEVDWFAGDRVWEWDLCDHYIPDPVFRDWAHLNAASPFGAEDAIIVSLRNQNSLIRIDRATGSIVWNMGFGGRLEDGFRGDFSIAENDRFYHQHAPEVIEAGTIVLFDNGHSTLRPYSRAIEIEYTFDPDGESSARVVWEYRHGPDLYRPIWGDADRLPNGNTLVTFGERSTTDATTIVEASPSSQSVWELRMPPEWGVYRSERVTAPPRGFVVADDG